MYPDDLMFNDLCRAQLGWRDVFMDTHRFQTVKVNSAAVNGMAQTVSNSLSLCDLWERKEPEVFLTNTHKH